MCLVKFVLQAFVTNFRAGFIIFQAIGLNKTKYLKNYSILDTAHRDRLRPRYTLDILKQYLNKLTEAKQLVHVKQRWQNNVQNIK